MASIQFTSTDRDDQGFIKAPAAEPRSLADLLPKPSEIKADAARRQPWTHKEIAALVAVALCAVFVLVYAWATPSAPTAAPTPHQTTVATLQPTSAPTVAPVPAAALVGYFDFADPASVAPIMANQIVRVVGTAGDKWRLVDVGNARVWIAADQVPTGIPADVPLPDLTPRRPAPAAPAPAVQPVAVPTAPPAPPPCAEAGVVGKMVSVCGYEDLSILQEQAKTKWIETYGGNIGIVSTPSPQVRQP